jgi:two-component system cell cycle response regulator DivK
MSKRVLIVEDQEDNRRIIRDLLRYAGYQTDEATTGEDAIEHINAQTPDLILMDVQLPGLDGYATTRRIKADPALRQVPVIAVTSFAFAGDDLKAREAGCDDYITKPYSPRKLLQKIMDLLG